MIFFIIEYMFLAYMDLLDRQIQENILKFVPRKNKSDKQDLAITT